MRRISDVANNDAVTKGLENASYLTGAPYKLVAVVC